MSAVLNTDDIRQVLSTRASAALITPRWIPMPEFASYGDWLDARGVAAFRQADYGFMWREERHQLGRRLSWIPETGELILVGPRGDLPERDQPIEIVARDLLTDEQVRRAMPRWAHAHNNFRDSLGWLRRTLAKSPHGAPQTGAS